MIGRGRFGIVGQITVASNEMSKILYNDLFLKASDRPRAIQ